MSLKRKTFSSLGWVFVFSMATRSSQFVTTLILAKLLDINVFGVYTLCLLYMEVLLLFRNMGFSQALIHLKKSSEKAANTATVVMIAIGLVLLGIGYITAPLIAVFFRNDILSPAFRILSLNLVISSLSMVPAALLEKELEFKKKAYAEIFPPIAFAVVAIWMAYKNMGILSIIVASLVQHLLQALLFWKALRFNPRLEFDKKIAKELFGFGKFVMGSGFTIFLFHNIDYMAIGRILGDTALGVYSFAYRIANFPALNITRLVGKVMFPAYSKIQDNLPKLQEAYLKTSWAISLVAFPICFGLLFFGKTFLVAFYADKWIDAVLPLQFLAFYGLFRCFGMTIGNIMMATGRPKWLMYISTLQLIIMGIFILPAIKLYGVNGVSLVGTVAMGSGILFGIIKNLQILKISIRNYSKRVGYPCIISLGIVLAVFFITSYFKKEIDVTLFSMQIIFSSILYVPIIWAMYKKDFLIEIKEILKR